MLQTVVSKLQHPFPVTILFTFCILQIPSCYSDFDRNHTGVVYGACVKHREYGEIPGWNTLDSSWFHVKTMLEVISGKFSKIATYGVGSNYGNPYQPYISYYESTKQAYTAEAAALINKERNETALIVFIGVWEAETINQIDTEIRVAMESAEKANNIFPGTAAGLIFTKNYTDTNLERASLILEGIKTYKQEVKLLGLKIGSRQGCKNILKYSENSTDKLANLQKQIVAESDFIICERVPFEYSNNSDPEYAFLKVKSDLLNLRDKMKKINPNIEVMGQTGWPSKGSYSWQNLENLKKYWEIVNKFGVEHNFQMWMFEAFDNPWKDWDPSGPHYGWWKLTNNSKIHLREGYVEKILADKSDDQVILPELKSAGTAPHSKWIYVEAANGVIFVLLLLVVVTLYILRKKRRQKTVSKSELEKFLFGIPNNDLNETNILGKETALKLPYDKSYEISKDKLKIYSMIGSGQFGCVFKATIQNEEGDDIQVALKMPKADLPSNILNGFLSEIKILIYLGQHENIVPIKGAYTTEISSGVVYIATELCVLGSLQNFLRRIKHEAINMAKIDEEENPFILNELSARNNNEAELIKSPELQTIFLDMTRWSFQIACGMEYLGTKHVVHADLATRNVLLTADKTAKITDFGLSRRLYEYTTYTKKQQEPLPWRWMSIESLKQLEFSSKSDVWSYGVTLWEIFSIGDNPYPGCTWSLDFINSLEHGMRMKCPLYATPNIFNIMNSCWLKDPHERLSFSDLKQSISRIIDVCDSTYTMMLD